MSIEENDNGTGKLTPTNPYTKKVKVLLREVECCEECGKSFLSLYPLGKCTHHKSEYGELEEV